MFHHQIVLPGSVCSTAAYAASGQGLSFTAPYEYSYLFNIILAAWTSLSYSSLCCPWTCLIYSGLCCPWTFLFSIAPCAAWLWTCLSYDRLYSIFALSSYLFCRSPSCCMYVSVLQQTVLPLVWTCLFYSSLCCPWTCLCSVCLFTSSLFFYPMRCLAYTASFAEPKEVSVYISYFVMHLAMSVYKSLLCTCTVYMCFCAASGRICLQEPVHMACVHACIRHSSLCFTCRCICSTAAWSVPEGVWPIQPHVLHLDVSVQQ